MKGKHIRIRTLGLKLKIPKMINVKIRTASTATYCSSRNAAESRDTDRPIKLISLRSLKSHDLPSNSRTKDAANSYLTLIAIITPRQTYQQKLDSQIWL